MRGCLKSALNLPCKAIQPSYIVDHANGLHGRSNEGSKVIQILHAIISTLRWPRSVTSISALHTCRERSDSSPKCFYSSTRELVVVGHVLLKLQQSRSLPEKSQGKPSSHIGITSCIRLSRMCTAVVYDVILDTSPATFSACQCEAGVAKTCQNAS